MPEETSPRLAVKTLPVLVVDDEQSILDFLTRVLPTLGFTDVHCFREPRAALASAAERRYAAALVDFNMPTMDGHAFRRELAAASPDTAFLLMTAYGERELMEETMAAGFHGYLEKPFGQNLLAAHLLGALYHSEALVNRRKLQRAKDEWLETMDALPHLVFRAGADDRILRLNRQALDYLGLADYPEAIGKPLPDLVPDAAGLVGAVHAVPEEMSAERRIGGQWFSITVAPLHEEGAYAGCNLTLTDISLFVHAREKVARAERLHGLGLTRAGVANDLRLLARELGQAFAGLKAAGDRLREAVGRTLPNPDALEALGAFNEALEAAEDADTRAEEFARAEMRRAAAAHDPNPAPAPVELGRFLPAFLDEMRREYATAAFRLDGDTDALPAVRADRVGLHLALAHLCRNAAEARPDATVAIAVESASGDSMERDTGSGEGANTPSAAGADRVRIVVADDAGGMPQDVAQRAFEPFFGTKDDRLGFGLNSVERVARDHDGAVTLDNRPGEGVSVTLTLPSAAGSADGPHS